MNQDMSIKLLFNSKYEAKFETNNIKKTLLNSIRRSLLILTPKMAIEHMFLQSGYPSRIDPETFALQVGQLPIMADADNFLYEFEVYPIELTQMDIAAVTKFSGCDTMKEKDFNEFGYAYIEDAIVMNEIGHGVVQRPHMPRGKVWNQSPIVNGQFVDERISLVFRLNVTCTFDHEKKQLIHDKVTTNDLIWYPIGNQVSNQEWNEASRKWFGGEPITIAHLQEGETLCADFIAVKGIGWEHSKWAPGTASDVIIPEITLCESLRALAPNNDGLDIEDLHLNVKRLVNLCHRKVFSFDQVQKKILINNSECDLCQDCEKTSFVSKNIFLPDYGKPLARVNFDTNVCLFSIRSSDLTPAVSLFIKAIKSLIRHCDELSSSSFETNKRFYVEHLRVNDEKSDQVTVEEIRVNRYASSMKFCIRNITSVLLDPWTCEINQHPSGNARASFSQIHHVNNVWSISVTTNGSLPALIVLEQSLESLRNKYAHLLSLVENSFSSMLD